MTAATLAVREQLTFIYQRDGKLTAEAVLTEASDPVSPLHDRFEWDDTVAAHEHRKEQARGLIRAYRIRIHEQPLRAFTYVPSEGSYVPVRVVMQDKDMRAEVVALFHREAKAFEARWRNHRLVAGEFQRWAAQQASTP